MKKIAFNMRLFLALIALTLAGSTAQTWAQFPTTGSYTNNFLVGTNTSPFAGSGSVASWLYWYSAPGGNTPVTNDVNTPDPNGGAGAGSMEIYNPFGANHGYGSTNHTQNVFFGTFDNGYGYDGTVTANLLNFDTVSFDLYVGTNQIPPNTDGNYGTLNVGIPGPIGGTNWTWEPFSAGSIAIPGSASNGWVHISVPIDHTVATVTAAAGIAFDYNSYGGYPTNDFTFWIGHLTVHYNGAPPPPPTNYLSSVVPGLVQFADEAPTYNRQDIATSPTGSANLTWYGRTPVTYSWKIASWPSGAAGWTASLNLTPDPQASQIYSDPDWSATNDLWISIVANADGTVTAGIAYKTNQPAGNTQLFNPPTQLVAGNSEANGLTVPSAVGTWTLTFADNTDMTLTAPNGSSTNASLPANVAALYNGYVGAFLNSSPENAANIGKYMTYSAYNITGVATPVSENLASGALSAPFLQLISQNYYYTGNYTTNPPDQQFVTSADAYWLHWTIPDAGFTPIVSTKLGNATNWNDLVTSNTFTSGGQRYTKLTKAEAANPDQYYALIQRTFTQLQVLWPGQTNAPGTPNGYVGSPAPESVSGGYNGLLYTPVTINAVDSTFHIVNVSGDTVYLTNSVSGSDPLGIYNPPAALNNGTVQIDMTWGTQGSWTVSAGDSTETNIPPATSSTVTVGP
jgi:hypothetical protein